jgi:hypothetical protein
MENVTGKVFVMREVGFTWEDEEKVLGSVDVREVMKRE